MCFSFLFTSFLVFCLSLVGNHLGFVLAYELRLVRREKILAGSVDNARSARFALSYDRMLVTANTQKVAS